MFHDHVQWGVLSQMKPSREGRDGSFRVMVLQLRVLSGNSARTCSQSERYHTYGRHKKKPLGVPSEGRLTDITDIVYTRSISTTRPTNPSQASSQVRLTFVSRSISTTRPTSPSQASSQARLTFVSRSISTIHPTSPSQASSQVRLTFVSRT
ncbi:hypothetical protein CDAR_414341 [Caerostris darwini]|uniref:Uncharacterized protein n=1 Tax=Caerostris darwini TaxID=1538125 RepID=A0AAV4RGJ8_9ARAC|nr:hypothetical protein CDAR_414341 [Caerostris darwini]